MKKKTFISISVISVVAIAVICTTIFVLMKLFADEGQFVRVTDSKGITKGNSVIWRDTYVGKVTGIKSSDGQIDIWFQINPEFKKQIRSDAKACLTVMKGSANPIILLVGGQNQSFPFLDDGDQLQELPEKDLPGYQLSDKISELTGGVSEEVIVWIVIVILAVLVPSAIKKNPMLLHLLLRGKKSGR